MHSHNGVDLIEFIFPGRGMSGFWGMNELIFLPVHCPFLPDRNLPPWWPSESTPVNFVWKAFISLCSMRSVVNPPWQLWCFHPPNPVILFNFLPTVAVYKHHKNNTPEKGDESR
ncbi:MAG: hypothetical protein JWR26_1791 [Pedosphaera sp.]|nr:hypothetical protein [Pedosphaera sp.]